MVVLSYEDWCDSYEDGVLDELEEWLRDCPSSEDVIQVDYEALLEEAYVSYVSDYGDYAYDQWKDEQILDLGD